MLTRGALFDRPINSEWSTHLYSSLAVSGLLFSPLPWSGLGDKGEQRRSDETPLQGCRPRALTRRGCAGCPGRPDQGTRPTAGCDGLYSVGMLFPCLGQPLPRLSAVQKSRGSAGASPSHGGADPLLTRGALLGRSLEPRAHPHGMRVRCGYSKAAISYRSHDRRGRRLRGTPRDRGVHRARRCRPSQWAWAKLWRRAVR